MKEDTTTKPTTDTNTYWPGVTIGKNCQFLGYSEISIGKGTIIGKNSWLNVCIRDGQKRIVIGEKVLIGKDTMLSTGGNLSIGDYCVFAPNVFVSDADHVFQNPYRPIMSQGAVLNKSISIGLNCWIGKNACIFGAISVNPCTIIGANSSLNFNTPGFCIVAGSPARIIGMYSFKNKRWMRTRFPFDIQRILQERLEYSPPQTEEYHEILDSAGNSLELDSILAGNGHLE